MVKRAHAYRQYVVNSQLERLGGNVCSQRQLVCIKHKILMDIHHARLFQSLATNVSNCARPWLAILRIRMNRKERPTGICIPVSMNTPN
jgi:hypothetical protein